MAAAAADVVATAAKEVVGVLVRGEGTGGIIRGGGKVRCMSLHTLLPLWSPQPQGFQLLTWILSLIHRQEQSFMLLWPPLTILLWLPWLPPKNNNLLLQKK